MTSESAPPVQQQAAKDGASASSQSLSQLLARILDQLSLSAWLPAGIIVASVWFSIMVRLDPGGGIGTARDALTSASWVHLFGFIGLVVLLTTVTQAFEFEAIRVLEGYWPATGIGRWASQIGCQRQLRLKNRAIRRRERAQTAAFDSVAPDLRSGIAAELAVEVDTSWGARKKARAIEINAQRFRSASAVELDVGDVERFNAITQWAWPLATRPDLLRRIDYLQDSEKEFPKPQRLLPTKFGNIMRSYEEGAFGPAGRLEGKVQEVFDSLPPALRQEHDEAKNKLHLYCTLVLTMLLLAPTCAAIITRDRSGWPRPVFAAAICLVLALLFARASNAAARAYGNILMVIGRLVAERRRAEANNEVKPSEAPNPAARTADNG